ncbi:MAG: radical SAM protein [Candidatus Lokiarchaeota archaeon]|nr:radical SAM protein [Candidatus Lokiarchaeota archaeon]
MTNIHKILANKTELLCKGIYVSNHILNSYNKFNFGRKGGAGPSGGRYFLLDDNKSLVNVTLLRNPKKTDLILKNNKSSSFEVINRNKGISLGNIKLINLPKFQLGNYKTSDGILMKKIALVHGIDSLATTIYQKCDYWECGNACKFCGIQISLDNKNTILEKNAKQISEVITEAEKEGRCSHLTLTSGTEFKEDKGALRYIKIIKELKNNHPEIPIHIQIEPLLKLDYLDQLKESGADTIGIHIEILDETIRKKIIPGKSILPYQLYIKNWKYAIDVFGKNQVESFILVGLGEDKRELINGLQNMISIGIIPYITPVRIVPGRFNLESSIKYESLLEVYYKTAEMMKEYGVNPLEHKAGCVKCGGCSAINEAYKALE